jgi:hypothetical protein
MTSISSFPFVTVNVCWKGGGREAATTEAYIARPTILLHQSKLVQDVISP